MYAKVVIDIPDIKHQGFDYQIPEIYLETLQVGSRVLVPLANRMVQGFVIDIHEQSTVANVKPIDKVIDLIPSLSKEMVDLGLWMSQHYISQLYRTYQILLPSALKTKMEQYLLMGYDDLDNLSIIQFEIADWVSARQPIHMDKLLERFPSEQKTIKRLISDGILELQQEFKDKTAKKKSHSFSYVGRSIKPS
ncbi:hypothetical protein [Tepidibacillus marianensis]|uniref:primosomal protein N' family DNA-binding protein n=1 Tax=Tepidibacillus marianensis TaxID=3131995 RepID=UPI0030D5DB79